MPKAAGLGLAVAMRSSACHRSKGTTDRTSSSGTNRASKAIRTVEEAPMAARASGGEARTAGGSPSRRKNRTWSPMRAATA
jgi:hypothetical protein